MNISTKVYKKFEHIFFNKSLLSPTNKNIIIFLFNISIFNFYALSSRLRITFVWHQDPSRLWIRFIYIFKGLKKTLLPHHFFQYIHNARINKFNALKRKELYKIYAKITSVIGVYGSSMIFPSIRKFDALHKRGNNDEDILFKEYDVRVSAFHRHIVPGANQIVV